MRILVANDDGIHAPGLKVLETIARQLSKDVWVVAPETEQSGASHSLTLTSPLRVRRIKPKRFAVSGTPTDCVMMAINQIMAKSLPDLVLSGVNRGSNMGEDVTYSGTVAAAMEATLLGVPAIALSQVMMHGEPVKWSTAADHGAKVIRRLLKAGWPKGTLINVNFPNVPSDQVQGVSVCAQGQRDQTELAIDARLDARNVPYYWLGFRRSNATYAETVDLGAAARGFISVTPLHVDLTHRPTLTALRKALG
jgi:5'/3'-nucleotidase SurE